MAYPEVYTDDERMVADMIKREWDIPFDIPKIYFIPNAIARVNIPGSIYIYDMGRNIPKYGINYEYTKRVRRLGIDIQNPENRDRHFAYVNEVIRILMKYRRAGRSQLGGYDYLEINNITDRQGYTNYYHTVMDISLTAEVSPIPYSGFNTPCERKPTNPPCNSAPDTGDHPPSGWSEEGREDGV